jgi:putative phosphoribosyl transferase
VCLLVPENFQAVGQFYQNFSQVEDDDVVDVLKRP